VAAKKRIGEILIEANLVTQAQLEQALTVQKANGRKLGQVLMDLGMVAELALTQALSRQLSVAWVSLYHIDFSRSLLNLVTPELAEKYSLVPVLVRKSKKEGATLYVAMDDPTNEAALGEVTHAAGMPVRSMIACPSDIKNAIRVYYLGGEPTVAPAPPPPPAPSPAAPPANVVPPNVPPPTPSETALPLATMRDSSGSSPEIDATEIQIKPTKGKRGQRMVALTFLDGTTIQLPAAKRHRSQPAPDDVAPDSAPGGSDQLTARDIISALRAVSHGADASEIWGEKPPNWEAMFATLLSLMLKKGMIADWEFVEEFRKI
jgi:type IV pilus assembly protein PilB